MNFIVLIAVVVVFLVLSFNKMVDRKNKVDNAWGQVDVQLKRRFDLIPNLVETIKGAAAHEKNTLEDVIRARNSYLQADSPAEAMKANKQMTSALTRLLAVVENYPDLKANVGFTNLQEELSRIEDKIAYSRQFYNDTVMKYNKIIMIFPNNIFAGMFGFTKEKYFNADESERSTPKVEF